MRFPGPLDLSAIRFVVIICVEFLDKTQNSLECYVRGLYQLS
jgi:hypothetical protein